MWDKIRYQQELQDLHHRRVYYILFVGSIIMLTFSLLDYIIARQYFFLFLKYRLVTACTAFFLILANYYDRQKRWSYIIGLSACIAAGIVVLLMIHKMGAPISPYYVGLIVILTIYTTLAPITFTQTLFTGMLLIVGYCVAVFYGQEVATYENTLVFNNVFFMICFVFIVAIQSQTETRTRKQEFSLRLQEEQAARDLDSKAQDLEDEVRRRTAKQQQSEQQYQTLFESLVDDVVLVDIDGFILRSNAAFKGHFSHLSFDKPVTVFDVVSQNHHDELHKRIQAMFMGETFNTPSRLTFIAAEGRPVIMELKSSLIRGIHGPVGVQLVLRDISVREQLNEALIESLDTIRQTEEAAILSLAKLAEYREGRPGEHLERIRVYCKIIASQLLQATPYTEIITPAYLQDIYNASILHDIGKVAVPDTVLKKTEPLTDIEQDLVRQHTVVGGDVIKEMEVETTENGFLDMAKKMAYFHHEQWDGKGYPNGLSGEDIPLEARILAIAEAYEHALGGAGGDDCRVSNHNDTLKWIQSESGKRFDPVIVEAMMRGDDALLQVNRKTFESNQKLPPPVDHRI